MAETEELIKEDVKPAAKKTAAAPRKRAASGTGARRGRPAKKKPDYTEGINGLFQLVSVPLAFTAPHDAVAVATHGPNIASAVNTLAQERPEVAAALEKVLKVGPYGALIGAVIPLAVQIMHNHNVIPEHMATQLGATPKREIDAYLKQQGEMLNGGEN